MARPVVEVITFQAPVPYAEALELQLQRQRAVARGEAGNALFLLEHPPVITMGRNSHPEHLLQTPDALRGLGIELHAAQRGGDVTFHGPGQLVAYPILNLREWRLSLAWYLRALEQTLIECLKEWGVQGHQIPGHTGVWVGDAKVAAIGVGVSRWTTFHGVALNVSPQLSHFGLIVPCGIADRGVTSLEASTASPPSVGDAGIIFQRHFAKIFGCALK